MRQVLPTLSAFPTFSQTDILRPSPLSPARRIKKITALAELKQVARAVQLLHDLQWLVINADNGLRAETIERAFTLERLSVLGDVRYGESPFGFLFGVDIAGQSKVELRAAMPPAPRRTYFARLYHNLANAPYSPAVALSTLLFLFEDVYRTKGRDNDSFGSQRLPSVAVDAAAAGQTRDEHREKRALDALLRPDE